MRIPLSEQYWSNGPDLLDPHARELEGLSWVERQPLS
jgi:hypothetical protein